MPYTAGEVCELINNKLITKPGWRFVAEPDLINKHEVWVDITYPARDSGRENARQGYRNRETEIGAYHRITFDRTTTRQDIVGQMLAGVVAVETHEWREFLRLADQDCDAPFHPHRPEGRAAWRAVKGEVTDLIGKMA
jgi:hypothetical protein